MSSAFGDILLAGRILCTLLSASTIESLALDNNSPVCWFSLETTYAESTDENVSESDNLSASVAIS